MQITIDAEQIFICRTKRWSNEKRSQIESWISHQGCGSAESANVTNIATTSPRCEFTYLRVQFASQCFVCSFAVDKFSRSLSIELQTLVRLRAGGAETDSVVTTNIDDASDWYLELICQGLGASSRRTNTNTNNRDSHVHQIYGALSVKHLLKCLIAFWHLKIHIRRIGNICTYKCSVSYAMLFFVVSVFFILNNVLFWYAINHVVRKKEDARGVKKFPFLWNLKQT